HIHCAAATVLPKHSFSLNHTTTREIYTLSLHDALPIYSVYLNTRCGRVLRRRQERGNQRNRHAGKNYTRDHPAIEPNGLPAWRRSEEHTSELQSRENLVCRLLLEKKKQK